MVAKLELAGESATALVNGGLRVASSVSKKEKETGGGSKARLYTLVCEKSSGISWSPCESKQKMRFR